MKSKRLSLKENIKETKRTYKNRSKSKSKSKSKKKTKKFHPINYLNTLIDLQNTPYFSNRKKIQQKRNISSALTVATPAV